MGAVPTSYVIDRYGKIVYAQAAAFDIDALNALIIPLLNEPIPETSPPAAPTAAAAEAKPAG